MSKQFRASSRTNGFTLIELLVVVVVIGIMISIGLPNYYASERRSQIASVKQNMHACQVAAEANSVDTGGSYPTDPAGLAPYMPGGANSPGGTAGVFPTNPCSGIHNETPAKCNINKSMWIPFMRTQLGSDNFGGTGGQTAYTGIADDINSSANDSFAVTGNAGDSKGVVSMHGYTILSNQ